MVICDTCGETHEQDVAHIIMDSMCVCPRCVESILILHLYSNPVRTLCPYCQDEKSIDYVCSHCGLSSLIEKVHRCV